MSSLHTARAHARRALRLVGQNAAREIIPAVPHQTGRWLMHDYPDPVARWNHHPEIEVHLLQYGSGWYIVGDRIGRYSAGQLVLIGSHLPHNWISDIDPGEHIADRDVVFQFHPGGSARHRRSCRSWTSWIRS